MDFSDNIQPEPTSGNENATTPPAGGQSGGQSGLLTESAPARRYPSNPAQRQDFVKYISNMQQIFIDAAHFTVEQLQVTVEGAFVVVKAKHPKRKENHGWISRKFTKKFPIAENADLRTIRCRMTPNHYLRVTVSKRPSIATPRVAFEGMGSGLQGDRVAANARSPLAHLSGIAQPRPIQAHAQGQPHGTAHPQQWQLPTNAQQQAHLLPISRSRYLCNEDQPRVNVVADTLPPMVEQLYKEARMRALIAVIVRLAALNP